MKKNKKVTYAGKNFEVSYDYTQAKDFDLTRKHTLTVFTINNQDIVPKKLEWSDTKTNRKSIVTQTINLIKSLVIELDNAKDPEQDEFEKWNGNITK